MKDVDVVIQGGGVAGLALARSLLSGGLSVSLVDSRSSNETGGAGILLQENALQALSSIGVAEADFDAGQRIKRINLGTGDRPKAMSTPVQGRALGLPRHELLRCLQEGVDGSCLTLGATLEAWDKMGDGWLSIKLSSGERLRSRVIVAADGAHSALREQIQGHKTRYRETGQYCWRCLLGDIDHDGESYELQNGKVRLGFIPTGERQLYIYLTESSLDGPSAAQKEWSDIRVSVSDFGALGKSIAQRIDSTTTLLRHPIIDGAAFMPDRSDVIFMGDAAHPMTPNLGQGAAMALEDAAILGPLLKSGNVDRAAERFYRLRRRRVAWLRSMSYWAGVLSHLRNPGLVKLRTFGLRCTPDAVVLHQQRAFNRAFCRQLKRVNRDVAGAA